VVEPDHGGFNMGLKPVGPTLSFEQDQPSTGPGSDRNEKGMRHHRRQANMLARLNKPDYIGYRKTWWTRASVGPGQFAP
jgi:hypothetical protein